MSNGTEAPKADAKALQVVDEMWQALGGRDAWQKIRYLSYHWIVSVNDTVRVDHRHDWDRWNNRYRLEGKNRQGKHYVALFNTQTKEGEVYLEGEKVSDDSTKTSMLQGAYRSFINDSYWLLMPYKLNDPGVILQYDGEKTIEGTTYDVVKVTFDNVGLTPGDTYWAYISKSDRLMHRWEYFLQNYPPDRERSAWWWKDWQDFSGIKLATNKVREGSPARIYFTNVVASPEVDEAVFEMTEKTF